MAAGPDALAALTATLRETAPDLLVAADEEGGDVTRVWYHTGSPYPGNAALGAVDDTLLTEEVHAAIGADLAALGVNLDLAPCLDVLAAPSNPVIGTRSFGADPELVARHGAAAVRGLQSAGAAACAKHFPGHGATLLDSHAELAVVPDGLAAVSGATCRRSARHWRRRRAHGDARSPAGRWPHRRAARLAVGGRDHAAACLARIERRRRLGRPGDAGGQRPLRHPRRGRAGRVGGQRPALPRPQRPGGRLPRGARRAAKRGCRSARCRERA